MIVIALQQDGVAQIVSPSRLFQGSDSETIFVLSPFPTICLIQISATLPDGTNDGYIPMEAVALPAQYAAVSVSAWRYKPTKAWTSQSGIMYLNGLVQIPKSGATDSVYAYNNLTTFMVQVRVEESMIPSLPEVTDQDAYAELLQIMASYAEQLQSIQAELERGIVNGVKGNAEEEYRQGNVNITPTNIGLGNVDNTADIDKPVSTAQSEAIAEAMQTAIQEAKDYTDQHAGDGGGGGGDGTGNTTVYVDGEPQSAILFDSDPQGQLNELAASKQDVLSFDTAPTEGSTNPVTSGGTYDAIQDALDEAKSYTDTTSPGGGARKMDTWGSYADHILPDDIDLNTVTPANGYTKGWYIATCNESTATGADIERLHYPNTTHSRIRFADTYKYILYVFDTPDRCYQMARVLEGTYYKVSIVDSSWHVGTSLFTRVYDGTYWYGWQRGVTEDELLVTWANYLYPTDSGTASATYGYPDMQLFYNSTFTRVYTSLSEVSTSITSESSMQDIIDLMAGKSILTVRITLSSSSSFPKYVPAGAKVDSIYSWDSGHLFVIKPESVSSSPPIAPLVIYQATHRSHLINSTISLRPRIWFYQNEAWFEINTSPTYTSLYELGITGLENNMTLEKIVTTALQASGYVPFTINSTVGPSTAQNIIPIASGYSGNLYLTCHASSSSLVGWGVYARFIEDVTGKIYVCSAATNENLDSLIWSDWVETPKYLHKVRISAQTFMLQISFINSSSATITSMSGLLGTNVGLNASSSSDIIGGMGYVYTGSAPFIDITKNGDGGIICTYAAGGSPAGLTINSSTTVDEVSDVVTAV